jgi:hypothetical protein
MMEASRLTTCQTFANGLHEVFQIKVLVRLLPSLADAPNIKQREQQPGVKQEQQVTYKKADDADEDCSCST